MAGDIGKIYVQLSLDDKEYKQKLSDTLTSTQATARGIETSWKALGSKSEAVYDSQRKAAENAYTLIKSHASSTANDIVRAEEAKNAKLKILNEQQFGTQISIIDSLKSHWMAASAAIAAGFYTVKKFFDLAELGAQIKSIEDSFTALANNAGISGDALIQKLKEVTNATVDSSDLMKKANRLIIEGFSAEQIIHIGEAARMAARLMGTDVRSAYESVSDAIVNLRQRGLKTAGFVIDLNEAYRKHADRLGIAKESLNDYGKQMALVEAVHEKYLENLAKTGPLQDQESEKIQKQKVLWKELKEEIAKTASSVWDYITSLVTASAQIAKGGAGAFEFAENISESDKARIRTMYGIRDNQAKIIEGSKADIELAKGKGIQDVKAQQQMMDAMEITKQTLQLRKGILGIGYQTVESKTAELEIERKLAIMALQQYGNTENLVMQTNKLFELRKKQAEFEERWKGALSRTELSVESYKQIEISAEGYNKEQMDLNQKETQNYRENVKSRMELSVQEYEQKVSNALAANVMILDINKRETEDRKAALYRTEVLELQNLETRISREKELREARVSLGWMRPAEAGLAGLPGDIELLKQREAFEKKRLADLIEVKAPLADIHAAEDRIMILKREQAVLEASRLRYISETPSAYDGLISGLKKYVTESGTFYTQLETMSYSTAKGMESAFSDFFSSIFDKGKSWQERMANLFKSLADSYIKALSDMAAKTLVSNLFGGKSGGGLLSLIPAIASIFGGGGGVQPSATAAGASGEMLQGWGYPMQKGGSFWANNPIPIMVGEGGESEFVSITPKSKMPSNQSISVGPINIQMEKGQGLNVALLKKDIEKVIVEVVKRHI